MQQKYIHSCNTQHEAQQIYKLALPKFGVICRKINLKFNQLFKYLLAGLFLFFEHMVNMEAVESSYFNVF